MADVAVGINCRPPGLPRRSRGRWTSRLRRCRTCRGWAAVGRSPVVGLAIRSLIFRTGPLHWSPMKGSWRTLLGIAVCMAGCGGREKPADPPVPPPGGAAAGLDGRAASSPLSAPVDYLGATAAGKRRAEGVVNLAPLLSALQQFHAAEDRYPARLQELVEAGFLARVPEVPPGRVLAYDPATGMVRLSAAPSADR